MGAGWGRADCVCSVRTGAVYSATCLFEWATLMCVRVGRRRWERGSGHVSLVAQNRPRQAVRTAEALPRPTCTAPRGHGACVAPLQMPFHLDSVVQVQHVFTCTRPKNLDSQCLTEPHTISTQRQARSTSEHQPVHGLRLLTPCSAYLLSQLYTHDGDYSP
jgi:hypothetical protein